MRIKRLFPLAALSSVVILQGCTTVSDPDNRPPSSPLTIQTSRTVSPESQAAPAVTRTVGDSSRRPVRPASNWQNTPEAPRLAAPQPIGEHNPGDTLTLNFVEADLAQVVRTLARFTGRNFIIDPRVQGQLTLVSEVPVSPQQAYGMLLGALRMQGFAVVHSEGSSKVVPESDAKVHASAVSYSAAELANLSGEIVTQVFNLNYEKAADLVPVLRPMVSPSNPITAYPNNNSLVITDYADNIARVADVIARIDTSHSLNTELITIEHGVALDVAALANQLLNDANSEPYARTQIVADPRTNSIIIRAGSTSRLEMAKDLIYKIDSPNARPNNLHVVYLKNAQATHLAQVLKGALEGLNPQSQPTATPGMGAPAATNTATTDNNTPPMAVNADTTTSLMAGLPQAATLQPVSITAGGATIQADPSTNTLIISAPPPLYRSIREVIDLLDQRRAQVLVESLIVEVNAEDAAEFGIQWMAGGSHLADGGSGFVGGTNLGGSGVGTNITGATTIDALGQGLSLGLVKGTVNILGQEIVNLGVLARALEKNGAANILSTPNLLTMDNEEASIIVGQTVPFVTGQYTTSGDGASNPFQTIEREDVGLTLRIRPQISEGGTVKLTLYQEVSSLDPNVTMSSATLVTRKRALQTNVLVDDGQVIVLGGLLEDSTHDSTSAVPILGSLPVVGSLFRYETRKRTKTNLMIFLRPHIVRDQQDSQRLTLDRYNYMRSAQQGMPYNDLWFSDIAKPTPLPDLMPLQQQVDMRGVR